MPPREPMPAARDDRAAASFQKRFQAIEDRLVARAGPPPDAEQLSEADDDHLWALKDPNVDPDLLASRLMTEGLSQEEAERLAVVVEMPDALPLYLEATQDAELADQLARMAEFPYRFPLLKDLDPPEQVKKANRLDARYQKAHGGQAMPSEGPAAPNVYERAPAVAMPAGVMPEQQQPMASEMSPMPVTVGG